MSELVEFLLARVTEDETAAADPRAIAECKAKRALLAEHGDDAPYCGWTHDSSTSHQELYSDGTWEAACPSLRALSLAYATDPGYRAEFLPASS